MKKFIVDFIVRESKWSSIRAISNSRMVKSSPIWLVIVPVFAKALSQLDDRLHLVIFEADFYINTHLPFAWQMLFAGAVFFSVANIIYRLYCPDVIKLYKNYREFEHSGKTTDQITLYLYDMVWNHDKQQFEDIKIIADYFYNDFSAKDDKTMTQLIRTSFSDHRVFKEKAKRDIEYKNKSFYCVRDFAQTYNQVAIKTIISLYAMGFLFVLVITLQNILFVFLNIQ